MKTITINSAPCQVDGRLSAYTLFQKASSNVDYFGTDHASGKLFVQFKGGSGAYIYSEVPGNVLAAAESSESIGKFIHSEVAGKYPLEKIESRLVRPAALQVAR